MAAFRRFLMINTPWNWLALSVGVASFIVAGLAFSGRNIVAIDPSAILLIAALFTGSAIFGLHQSSGVSARRRELALEILQKIRFGSPIYARAMEVVRQEIADASRQVERAIPDRRIAQEDLDYLLDFFRCVALGIEHAALDPEILRSALRDDLAALHRLLGPSNAAGRSHLNELRWLASLWRVA